MISPLKVCCDAKGPDEQKVNQNNSIFSTISLWPSSWDCLSFCVSEEQACLRFQSLSSLLCWAGCANPAGKVEHTAGSSHTRDAA